MKLTANMSFKIFFKKGLLKKFWNDALMCIKDVYWVYSAHLLFKIKLHWECVWFMTLKFVYCVCFYRGENSLSIDDSSQFIVVEYCRSEYEVKCQKYCIWVKKIKLINIF